MIVHRPRKNGRVAYWYRCDLCLWSGHWPRFTVLERNHETMHVCFQELCFGNERTRERLYLDGWTIVQHANEAIP
jgi:hypothetical protein